MNFVINNIYIFLLSIFNLMHPVHVSITNMDYIPDQKKITLSFKVFESDFQLLFAHLYQNKIDLEYNENIKNYQNKIDEYFLSHFKIIESKDSSYYISYTGMKKNEESIWFYYEASVENEIESIEIIDTIFLDLYFDQKNMLIFNYKNIEKGYLFNLKQTKQIITFNDF